MKIWNCVISKLTQLGHKLTPQTAFLHKKVLYFIKLLRARIFFARTLSRPWYVKSEKRLLNSPIQLSRILIVVATKQLKWLTSSKPFSTMFTYFSRKDSQNVSQSRSFLPNYYRGVNRASVWFDFSILNRIRMWFIGSVFFILTPHPNREQNIMSAGTYGKIQATT